MNGFKRYELKIRLKNGSHFKKEVFVRLKHEAIDELYKIHRYLFNYRIQN
ncbi:MAG: hypothetical protein ACJAV9_001184 [Urechidicola sp.]|jgi:hypothetical protein